ncbi:mitochondrial 50S ribosomal protein L22 [Mucidula mucida]|nr:mitochondrial 50S ribosomal protein L22 [Mucidula mucida]
MKEKDDQKTIDAAKKAAKQREETNVFEAVESDIVEEDEAERAVSVVPTEQEGKKKGTRPARPPAESHGYSTAYFKISHRKLNDIGRQIAGKPIDHAILQMQFSEKRASSRVMNMLITARDHAVRYKDMDPSKLIVAESWVGKGKHDRKRIEIKGRGHTGVQTHPMASLWVVLKEGKTLEQVKAKEKAYKLNKIVSAAATREDRPIRNPGAMWAW